MRLVIQRVSQASVSIDGHCCGAINHGLLILLGITHSDTLAEVSQWAAKVCKLRIFNDSDGKMNLSLSEVAGAVLVVSQFTLYGDGRKGNRPSFIAAARPSHAEPLYQAFVNELRQQGLTVATGQFGADMQVSLVNDGPVTIILE